MASTAVHEGTGTAITFASGFFAQVTGMNITGISRASIGTSHMGTAAPEGALKFANMTFIPGQISNPGELSVDMHFNPDTRPPIDQVAEALTVTFDEGATWVTSGYMTNFDVTGAFEDKMTATANLKISGAVTQTAA